MFPLASDIQRLDMEVHHGDRTIEVLYDSPTHKVTLRETVGFSGIFPPKKHSRYALLTKIFIEEETSLSLHYFSLFHDVYKYRCQENCYGYDLAQYKDFVCQYFVGRGSQEILEMWLLGGN